MAKKHLILWIGHALFIHSLTDGHLCCSPSSAIMNHTAMNINVQVFVGPRNTHILLLIYLGVKVLSHRVYVSSTLQENAKLFSAS